MLDPVLIENRVPAMRDRLSNIICTVRDDQVGPNRMDARLTPTHGRFLAGHNLPFHAPQQRRLSPKGS
jgi:hypothetical protein